MFTGQEVWRQLHREGYQVACCAVERLMRDSGSAGAVRGREAAPTVVDREVERTPSLVDRDFVIPMPNRCKMAGFAYVGPCRSDADTQYTSFA